MGAKHVYMHSHIVPARGDQDAPRRSCPVDWSFMEGLELSLLGVDRQLRPMLTFWGRVKVLCRGKKGFKELRELENVRDYLEARLGEVYGVWHDDAITRLQ